MPRRDLLPPYLDNLDVWTDLAEAIDAVWNLPIDVPKKYIQYLRETYLLSDDTIASKVEVFNIDPVLDSTFVLDQTTLDAESQSLLKASDFDTWEREILIKQATMLGFTISQPDLLSDDDYRMLTRNLALYWYSKGSPDFIKFLSFVFNTVIEVHNLWSDSGPIPYLSLVWTGTITSDKDASITVSGTYLLTKTSGSGTWGSARANVGHNTGLAPYYFEATIGVMASSSVIGIGNSSAVTNNFPGFTSNSWGYNASTGNAVNNNVSVPFGATFTAGDVIGTSIVFSPTTGLGTLRFYKNGILQGIASSTLPAGTYFPMVGQLTLNDTVTVNLNGPFVNTPTVSGPLAYDQYGKFLPEGDPGIGPSVVDGGTWFPTTHIDISYEPLGSDPGIEKFLALFNAIANYNLVIHAVTVKGTVYFHSYNGYKYVFVGGVWRQIDNNGVLLDQLDSTFVLDTSLLAAPPEQFSNIIMMYPLTVIETTIFTVGELDSTFVLDSSQLA